MDYRERAGGQRKKLVGFITILFFITSLFYSVYKRFSAPLYKGSFSIMIEDPFEIGNLKTSSRGLSPGDLISGGKKPEMKTSSQHVLENT